MLSFGSFPAVVCFSVSTQAELKAVNDKVEALEAQCAATVGEKKRLADEAETTANRLIRAEKLTSGLASEGVRWLESLENLGKQKVRLRAAEVWVSTIVDVAKMATKRQIPVVYV